MPERPEPEYGLGEAYRAKGELDKAAEHYSKALEIAPGSALFQEKLDEVLRQMQDSQSENKHIKP